MIYPLFTESVKAGFPSPASDIIESKLSLDDLLIQHPSSTFFLRVAGNSMNGIGIFPDDILVVDKSLEPIDGKIVIAAIDGDLTVKRLQKKKGRVLLIAENPNFSPIDITNKENVVLWGVVTSVIHRV